MIKKLILALILLSVPALSWAGPAPGIKTPTFQSFGSQTITEFKANGGVDFGDVDRNGNITIFRSDGGVTFGDVDRQGNITTYELEGYGDGEDE